MSISRTSFAISIFCMGMSPRTYFEPGVTFLLWGRGLRQHLGPAALAPARGFRLARRHEIIYRQTMPRRLTSLLDKTAMTLSGVCLLHCLAGSLVLTLFAASGGWLGHDVHLVGLGLALPLAAVALWRGVALHHRIGVALLGAAGIALMTASLFIAHGGTGEVMVSVLGVSLLGLAHLWNLRAARR